MYSISPEEFNECWRTIKAFAPRSISWNHYDLAIQTEINDVELWKAFLLTPEVRDWLEEERALLQDAELAKLTANVSTSRSVGQAQLISAMNRLNDANKEENATGPAFIYTYIPLTIDQQHAPNVQMLTEDIFYVKPPTTTSNPAPTTPANTQNISNNIDEFKFDPPPELST